MAALPPKPPTPRWVKAFAIVFIAVAALIVVLLLTDGGRHGPGRHMGPNGEGRPAHGFEIAAGVPRP